MEGGVGAFTQALALALAEMGHEIHIITSRQARPVESPRRVRLLFAPVDMGYARLHPQVRHWRWRALDQVADVAVRYELDVVNIQYQAAAYSMRIPAINWLPWRLRGVTKTAVTFHDLRTPYLFPKAGRLRHWVVRRMAQMADGAIVTNAADFAALQEIRPLPIAEIPIGSNIPTYTPNHIEIGAVRQQLGLQADDRLLGYFGFLNDSKGADTLIEALARLDERYHLVFIGGQTGASDGSNNARFLADLAAQIAARGLSQRVHWTGFLSDERVSTHLHAADMMVMPYRDGASLRRGTLMAALAHERPLISTCPLGATPHLAHGENIWFVPVGDAAAVATAVQTISYDAALQATLRHGAGAVAHHFSWPSIAAQTADFFQSLL